MVIRFQCPSCQHAIEADEPWALELVECPFCEQAVRVPGQSTIPLARPADDDDADHRFAADVDRYGAPDVGQPGALAPVEQAPVGPGGGGRVVPGGSGGAAAPIQATGKRRSGKLAWAALIVSCVGVILAILLNILAERELRPRLNEQLVKQETPLSTQDLQRIWQEAIDQGEPWAFRLAFGGLASFFLLMVGFVLALIALARGESRRIALAALLIAGLPLALAVVVGIGVPAGG